MTTTVQQRYPIRYWTTFAYLVGVPNFLHFDPTGRTHDFGLFNLTSISDIALTLGATTVFVLLTLLERSPVLVRKLRFAAPVWMILAVNMIIASVLAPQPRLVSNAGSDLALSLFRMAQWALGLVLVLSLYSRASPDEAPRMMTQLVGRACWANILLVWAVLPIAPSLVYASQDLSTTSTPRLGGLMIHPGVVALLASMAFFHGVLMLRSWPRVLACGFALITLTLTYTRSSQIAFLLALMLYLLLRCPRRIRLLSLIALLSLAVSSAVVFRSGIAAYLARGQQAGDIESLSGRVDIWSVALNAAAKRPFLGYGFIAGPRNVLRDNWVEVHWVPPHAHNELVQAYLSGGVVAAVLITWLYLYVLWIGFRRANCSKSEMFFFLAWVQLCILAFISTNLTTAFTRMGGLLLCAFVVFLAGEWKTSRVAESAANDGSFAVPALGFLGAGQSSEWTQGPVT